MGPHDKPSVPEHINTEEGDIDTEWESRRSRFYNVRARSNPSVLCTSQAER